MKIVLCCSLMFYAAGIEFVFGAVYRGMTESEPGRGDMRYNM
jgi:hypothetical protein